MHRIVVIHGSPHRGATYDATMDFLQSLGRRLDTEVEHVALSDEGLEHCRGCGNCVTQGEEACPNKDGLQKIHAAMRKADAIIITTPVYALHVTALVKGFVERSAYVMHRPRYFGKWFMSISTQYISGDKDVERYLANVMRYWGCNIMPGLRLTMSADRETIRRRTEDAVQAFCIAVKRNSYPAPSLKDLMMFRFRRSAVAAADSFRSLFPRDVEYFERQGWSRSLYYYDVRLNPVMKAFGAIIDAVGRSMVNRENLRLRAASAPADRKE